MTVRVLVTGATGLIGRRLVAELAERGLHVIAVSRGGAAVDGAVDTLAGDLLIAADRAAVLRQARATHMVHLAWHDDPRDRMDAPENLDWAAATIALVAAFAATGGRRVVAAGSCAEYDWSYQTLNEDTPLRPATQYGRAKARTGQLLVEAAPALGLSLAWARIFFCYGPGEPRGRLLGDLIGALRDGVAVDCTDGRQVRDYLHTADVASALLTVLMSDATGAINIASGRGVEVRDLIGVLGRLSGQGGLFRLGARPRPEGDPPKLVGDATRLAGLGFAPAYDLQRGLRDCLHLPEADPVRTTR